MANLKNPKHQLIWQNWKRVETRMDVMITQIQWGMKYSQLFKNGTTLIV
jgi:hypothetical protein